MSRAGFPAWSDHIRYENNQYWSDDLTMPAAHLSLVGAQQRSLPDNDVRRTVNATKRDLVAEAVRIQPLLMENSQRHDELNALSPEVVEALHEAGLFGMWVPAELGGSELSPRESLEVISTLAYADPATAWVVMAAALATGTGGAYADERALPRLFGGERFPVIAGQGTRLGTAKVAEGGYLLSGDWSFGSGLKHSGWVHTAAAIPETGEARIFLLPVEHAQLDESSWDVLGLKGTGSIDYHLRDVFVPEEFSYDMMLEEPRRGGQLFSIGTIKFSALCHSGWAIGAGRRLLDEVLKLAQAGKGRAGQLAKDAGFHAEVAKIEGKFRAARAFLFETWAGVEEALAAGQKMSLRQETLVRLGISHMTWTAYDVAEFALRSTATTAIRPGVIEHYIRDILVATTHLTSSQPVQEAIGRELAGLAPGEHWVFLGLEKD